MFRILSLVRDRNSRRRSQAAYSARRARRLGGEHRCSALAEDPSHAGNQFLIILDYWVGRLFLARFKLVLASRLASR